MNRRLLLATVLLAVLAVSAGCAGPLGSGGGDLQERVSESADYDWSTSKNVTIDVRSDEYTAVYAVENRSTLELHHYDSFGGEAPLPISAVQFRHPNGTVVDHEAIQVEETRHKTILTLPAEEGKLAFTAPAGGKEFNLPVFVEGSYEVTLPPGMRVGVFLLSDVRPRGYEATVEDGRTTIEWDEVTSENVVVRYYLERDLTIFASIVALLTGVALVGLGYFVVQIRRLEERREEMGLDVDTSDDDVGDRKRPPFR
jgi:hypothetical protein